MQPTDFLQSARILLDVDCGRPTAVSVRRAMSAIYYALFHCLANDCADLLIGATKSARSDEAWQQVYRSLDHGTARERCRDKPMLARFPKAIEDFASAFVTMQEKRHRADYDPPAAFDRAAVQSDALLAERVIRAVRKTAAKDRRSFCASLLLKRRN